MSFNEPTSNYGEAMGGEISIEQQLKQVQCSDNACGFSVKGRDETELVDILIKHAKRAHNLEATIDEVKAKIQTLEGV